jgi:hypothetical protein
MSPLIFNLGARWKLLANVRALYFKERTPDYVRTFWRREKYLSPYRDSIHGSPCQYFEKYEK